MSRAAQKTARAQPSGTAKLFRTGGSQAVRLPKSCRLPGEEVLVRKIGDSIVLSPLPQRYSASFRDLLLGPPRALVSRGRQGRLERSDLLE